MDEPTNHLDVDAKDELKLAPFKLYKGTILMVSHEPEFYQDIVNPTSLIVKNGRQKLSKQEVRRKSYLALNAD